MDDDDAEYVEAQSDDGGDFDSKSAVMRDCIRAHKRESELREEVERLRDRLESREERVETLEQQLAERSQIEDKIEDLPDKIRDTEPYQERRQRMLDQASVGQRLKWKVTGVPVSDRSE